MKSTSRKLSCKCGLAAALAVAGLSLTEMQHRRAACLRSDARASGQSSVRSAAKPVTAQHERSRHARSQTVRATRYSSDLKGNRTSGGGIYDPNALTAASRTLPLGSTVKVTDVKSGRSVNVLINDRGPRGRSLDLSAGAARALGLGEDKGVTKVKITRQLRPGPPVRSY